MREREYMLSEQPSFGGIRSYHSLLLPQARAYNAHHHTECEISIFLRGSGVYTVGEKRYEFGAGSIFLFGSNEEHCITEIHEEIDLLNVQFEPYILWERDESAELMLLFHARNARFENRLTDGSGRIGNALLALERELSEKRPCYAMAVRYCLFMALTEVLRESDCVDYEKNVRTSDSVTQSLRLTIDYIQEHIDKKLTLCELASVACLSPTYLSCVFKRVNGISLWDYINIKRVERAIVMLKNERLTKLEIAERCGFSSASNFYKTFTAVTGKKPKDFVPKA